MKKLWFFLKKKTRKHKIATLVILLILIVAVPLTVSEVGQRQDLGISAYFKGLGPCHACTSTGKCQSRTWGPCDSSRDYCRTDADCSSIVFTGPAKYRCIARQIWITAASGAKHPGEYVNECIRDDKYGKYTEPTCSGNCDKKYTFYACGLPTYTCIALPKQYFSQTACEIDLRRDPLYKRKYFQGWCYKKADWCKAVCDKHPPQF